MVIGLILIINPIICEYDLCVDYRMKGFYLNSTTFKQYGIRTPDQRKYNQNYYYFLKKVDYKFPYQYVRDCYGNTINKIDFKRDFHMGFRSKPLYEDCCWFGKNYGLAIVFGEYEAKSYKIDNDGPKFLVHGLDRSIVILLRYSDQSVVIVDCLKQVCDVDNAKNPIGYYNQISPSYNIYLHIIYRFAEHSIEVYKNDYNYKSNLIVSYDQVYLTDILTDRGRGYLGITATDYEGPYFHNIFGTYYCINGGEKIVPTVTLNFEKEKIYNNETIIVPPLKTLTLKVEYNTKRERELMGPGTITVNGKEYLEPPSESDNIYTFNYYTSDEYGLYTLIYSTDYDDFIFKIMVQSSNINKLNYVYGESSDKYKYEIEVDVRILKYGTLNGDFDFSKYENSYLYFHVVPEDDYGYQTDIREINKIRQDLIEQTKYEVTIDKVEESEHIYRIGVPIKKKGIYLLSSSYFEYPISFNVINLVPSKTKSICKIEDYLQDYVYDREQKIKFVCEFRDSEGDEINIVDAIKYKNLIIQTNLKRNDILLEVILEEKCRDNKCNYTYLTDFNGKYKFVTKFGFDGNMETIDTQPNTFNVSPEPLTLEGCYFYNYDIDLFIHIDSIKNTIFNYYEDNEDNEDLLLIDLVDTKDKEVTRYSDIEYSYANFDPNKIKGNIFENHSNYTGLLTFKETTFREKKYILVQLDKSNKEMKRSSLHYTLNIDFKIQQNLNLSYFLPDLDGYIACGKELEINNSIIKTIYSKQIKAGSSEIIAQLVLRTDEEHLYNYLLESNKKINFIEENYKCLENNKCEINAVKTNIEGIYNIEFKSENAGNFKVKVQIDEYDLKKGNNYYNVEVESIPEAYYLEQILPYNDKYIIGVDEVKLGFLIKDKYGNPIDVELPLDKFGLYYELSINGGEKTKYDKFEKGDDGYYIKEYGTISGDYVLTLKTTHSVNNIEYKYYKGPGIVYTSSSSLKVINSNKLNLHEEAKAEIYLFDIYGNSINADKEAYDREVKKVEIYALNGNKQRIDYSRDVDNKFITEPVNIIGTYHIYGKIGEDDLRCISPLFEVVDYGYDFYSSQLKMIGETIILMKPENNYILYKGLQRPAFEFDFMTENGLPSNKIDNETIIIANIINLNNEKETLIKIWIDINKILWVLPDDYDLSNGNYLLQVANNNTKINYYISILEYGEDTSNKSYYINNTFVSPNILYLKAGISDSFIVELRDTDHYRYNQPLDIKKFDYTSSDLGVTPKKGNKNGQIIVEVKSEKTCDFSKNCKISMKYDEKEIETEVKVVVSAGELDHFLVDEINFCNEDKCSLNPGTAGIPKKINLIPIDKYKNNITDSIFDKTVYPEESLIKLFNLKISDSDYSPSLISSTNPVSHTIELSLSSEKAGTLTLSSIYLDKIYSIEIKAGEASKYSTGYLDGETGNTTAGEKRIFVVEPKDEKGNKITAKEIIDEIIDKYSINIYDLDGNLIEKEISGKYINENNRIEYVINNEKVETKIVKAYYNDEEIILSNNVIYIVSGEADLDRTIIKYNDQQYKISETLKISLANLPIIDFQLNDKFGNEIDILPIFKKVEFYLLKDDNILSDKISYNKDLRLYIKDSKVDDYFKIDKSQNDCKLIVKFEDITKEINIIFEDKAPTEDKDKPTSFIIDTDELILKAGEKGIVSLSFYTEKAKPMGYYFNPLSQIILSCDSDKEIESYILLGKNYGIYNIIISSIYDVDVTCTVNAINKSQNFTLKVIPNKVNNCKLSSDNILKAVAGELYQLKLLCYDEFGNKAHLFDGEFGALVTNEYEEKIEYDINFEKENIHNLYILPKKSGTYTIKSIYLSPEITFDTLYGEISPENSYLEIEDIADAGKEIDIKIHALDKYGNEVNLDESQKSIFDLYYRYQKDSVYTKYEKIEISPEIEGNTFKYKKEVNKGGFNEFRAIHRDTSYIIKCKNCEVNVIPGEIYLKKSDVYKFNSFSKTYTKLFKFNDVLYSLEEDLFIKIYPKDIYGNKISGKNLEINVEIGEKPLSKVSSNEEFLEFQETKGVFEELKGEKNLVIYYGDDSVTYTVFVAGKDDFEENVEPLNSKLLESNLEFTAGQGGYFNFELRNSKNVRYNGVFKGEIEINTNVGYHIYNIYSSIILVVVKSTKSNTFPNIGESDLKVSINKQPVFDLELIIKPADLSTAELLSENLVDKKIQIKADAELIFSIVGRDTYGNLLIINPNEVKLKIKNKNNENEISYKSSYIDISNGQQIYSYDLILAGDYEISSGTNDEKKDLFNETVYTVEVKPGELSIEKTILRINSQITAGNKAIATIIPKDKNNNEIELDDIYDNFYSYIISNRYDFILPSKEKINEKKFTYEKQIDKIGTYQFNINYRGKKLKKEKVIVNPSVCNPEKTLIYSKDKNVQYMIYTKEINAYSSISSPLYLRLVFRDDHNNPISNINGITIKEAYLHGNNMKTLYWTYSNGELYLDLINPDNKKILEHLVTRTGENGYTFTFGVEYNNKNTEFNVTVSHFGKKEDEKDYGNGDYSLDKCGLNTDIAKFNAGTTFEVLLYLRTEEGLLFNGEFNIKNINCSELTKKDESFSCSTAKKDTGIYSIKYYSTMYKEEKDKYYNIIKLENSNNSDSKSFRVLLINTNGIPSKKYTVIIQPIPDKIKEEESQNVITKFTLKDEFGNPLESKDIINNLSFENHGSEITSSIDFDEKNREFSAKLKIDYPPKDISIQLYYNIDNKTKIDLFEEPQKSQFEFTVDYSKTIINSKNINRMKAGEFLDLNIITYDKNSQCYIDEDLSKAFSASIQGPLERTTEKKYFIFEKAKGTNCDYIYKIMINETNYYTEAGTYSIVVIINGKTFSTYTQTVISGDIDENNFVIYYIDIDEKSYTEQTIPAGETIHFMVQAYDKFNNKIDHESLPSDSFEIRVTPKKDENNIVKYNGGSGALSCLFNTTKIGTYKFEYYYKQKKINANTDNGPQQITYVPGDCSAEIPQVFYPEEDEIDVSTTYKYTIICLDKYGNSVNKGGAKFTSEISLFIEESQSKIEIEPKINDQGNGTYIISFIPPLIGGYSIYTYLDGNKYGELQFNLTGKVCDYYTCPNTGKCVQDLRTCIPDENRCDDPDQMENKPFKCYKNSTECVDSMTKCIPTDAEPCTYMKALYPKGKKYLCSYYLPLDCKRKYPNYRILCDDGICRASKPLQPNQRVCPIGKVLCADLTCKDSVGDCYNDWPECGNTQIRCPDQSCVDDQKNCPSTITCSNPDDFVCPDGTCVPNEIYCSRLKTCPDEIPYLCSDNSCATQPENCPHTVACGHGKSLCSDLICRESC